MKFFFIAVRCCLQNTPATSGLFQLTIRSTETIHVFSTNLGCISPNLKLEIISLIILTFDHLIWQKARIKIIEPFSRLYYILFLLHLPWSWYSLIMKCHSKTLYFAEKQPCSNVSKWWWLKDLHLKCIRWVHFGTFVLIGCHLLNPPFLHPGSILFPKKYTIQIVHLCFLQPMKGH